MFYLMNPLRSIKALFPNNKIVLLLARTNQYAFARHGVAFDAQCKSNIWCFGYFVAFYLRAKSAPN